MPKVSLSSENKVAQFSEYPKLSLEHGERALIVCIEPEPTVEFKHTLRAPEIGPNGKVIKEVKQNNKGEEYEATQMEFVGQHLCFGDFGTVQDKGVDPDNCPTCRAAEDEEGITPPTPHYAMHVIKYSLQPGGWTLREPFNVDLVAWVFSPSRLNTIIDFATEWGDLRQHDLKLGPCENKKFQKYDINVSANAQWLMGESEDAIKIRKNIVAQTYTNNQCADLSTLIARRISKADALGDVQKIIERMNQVYNRGGSSTQVPDLSALTQNSTDVAAVLTEAANSAQESDVPAPANLTKMDFSEIMAGL